MFDQKAIEEIMELRLALAQFFAERDANPVAAALAMSGVIEAIKILEPALTDELIKAYTAIERKASLEAAAKIEKERNNDQG